MSEADKQFNIRDYLREYMFPHFLCPGCGHGIALRALLWAIDELDIDKDRLAFVSGIAARGDSAPISTPIPFTSPMAARWPSLPA